MRCRVFYTFRGRQHIKDVTAAKADAEAVFRHTADRHCIVERVEEIGHGPAARPPGSKPRLDLPRYHAITESERGELKAGFAALRERLRKMEKPASERSRPR